MVMAVMAKPIKMNKEADMARSMGVPVDRLWQIWQHLRR